MPSSNAAHRSGPQLRIGRQSALKHVGSWEAGGRGRRVDAVFQKNRSCGSTRASLDWQKRAIGTPLISPGPALVANALRPGQEKHTMFKLKF